MARMKKTALFTLWGSAKATATPLIIREGKLPRKRRARQDRLDEI